MSLTEQEIIRYSRHIILPEVGGRGQRKLKEASVLLAGVGAAGSAAALYLAAAGIGRITLWDPSLVVSADLASSIAHDQSRLGTPRARSAAVPLRAINPAASVEVLDRESDVVGALPEYHVVLLSTGDWSMLEPAVLHAGGSAVLYGVQGARGAVTVTRPGGPSLQAIGSARAAALGLAPEESGVPAVAAAAGVIGVVAATEAIKLILGAGSPLAGRILCYDGWSARFEEEVFA